MTTALRELVAQVESAPAPPASESERFDGYGVMGLPFASGHVLALRRFTSSSVGPGYTSVWHRTPGGAWSFYSTAIPRLACTRYFGEIATQAIETEVALAWTGPDRLRVSVPSVGLEWEVGVASTAATRVMNAIARLLPEAAWRSPSVLRAMEVVARAMLGVGRVGLSGRVPNGQRFVANPRVMWAVVDSRALLGGQDLGPPGPVQPQARLEDFWIPQRGIFALGRSHFEPFDPACHSARTNAGLATAREGDPAA